MTCLSSLDTKKMSHVEWCILGVKVHLKSSAVSAFDILPRNYASIMCHLPDIGYSELFAKSRRGFDYLAPHSNFAEIFGTRKLDSVGCSLAFIA